MNFTWVCYTYINRNQVDVVILLMYPNISPPRTMSTYFERRTKVTKKNMVLLRVMSRAAGIFLCLGMVVLLVNAAHAQSFWEKRQKRVEEMRKKDLKKPPQDKMIVTPETKPVPEEEIAEPAIEEEFTLPPLEMFEPEETLGLKEITRVNGPDDYIDPEEIKIPEEYGTIKAVHKEEEKSKLIIHIQDAHMNYDAQMSIAHIMEEVLVNHGINLTLLEGGIHRDVGVGEIKWTGFRSDRVEVARKYVKEGKFVGPEYLDAVSDYPLIIRGMENKGLFYHLDNLHLKIMNMRQDVKDEIKEMQVSVINLKAGVFNKALLKFDSNKKDYNEEKITLTEYSRFLESKAKDINIKKKAPNFDKLLQTIKLEQEIDFPGVDDERTKLIDELTKGADKKKSDELVQKSLDFRQGKVGAVDYYAYLRGQYKKDLEKEYPNLDKYIRYITIHKAIDTHLLFSDIDEFEWDIRNEYYENKNQKKLDHIARNLNILQGLFELALTPDEYAYYKKNQKEFRNVHTWINDLMKLIKKMNLQKQIVVNINLIVDNLTIINEFYDMVYKRDVAFIEKAKEVFEESEKNAIIMVAGGFHTPNLVELFRQEKLSYVVIAPKIENPTEPGLYDKIKRAQIEERKKQKK